MARRENQGIQIAMIVFILTTLLFLVTTYFGYSNSTKYAAEAESLRGQLQTANSGLSSSEQLVSTLKQYTGVAGDDDAGDPSFAATGGRGHVRTRVAAGKSNFQDIAKLLTDKIQQQYGEIAQARDTEKQLRSELGASSRDSTEDGVRGTAKGSGCRCGCEQATHRLYYVHCLVAATVD